MPTNPNLFPATYTDRCPSTQTNEVDRVAQLEQVVLLVRAQLQTEVRKSGRSAAELQNQTIAVTRAVFPPTTVGKSFIGGGAEWDTGQVHGQIDKLTHVSDSIAPLDFSLTSRLRHFGVESDSYGYWAGGESNLNQAQLTTIEAIDFVTELRRTVSATLPAWMSYGAGVSSSSRGYFCGQVQALPTFFSTPGTIRYIAFSTETTGTVGANLGQVSGGCNAVSSSTAAYLGGGWDGATALRRFSYSGETVSTLSQVLGYSRIAGSTHESQRAGYFHGGAQSDGNGGFTTPTTIERLTFSGEILQILGQFLPKGDADCHGASALRQGYHIYSETPGRLAALSYVTETFSYLGAVLSRGGRYAVPVGKP